MKTTCLFGLLLCLTSTPTPAVSRLLDEKSESKKNEASEKNENEVKNEKDEYYEKVYGDILDPPEDLENDLPPVTDTTDPIAPVSDITSGSMDYGYVEAKMLWVNGLYECQTFTEKYWIDVQTHVFAMCDSKWAAGTTWAAYSQDCKLGAEKFAREEMDKCFDVAECSQVGVSAAASVAGIYCKQNGLFHEPTGWIPTKCVQHAQVSCKYDAVETIQNFNQGGVCAADSALDHVDEIYQLCDEQIAAMEQAAQLSPYSDGTFPSAAPSTVPTW
jgi:hypothetical protein